MKKKFLSGSSYLEIMHHPQVIFDLPSLDRTRTKIEFWAGKIVYLTKAPEEEAQVFEIQASLRRLRRSGVIWKHKRLPNLKPANRWHTRHSDGKICSHKQLSDTKGFVFSFLCSEVAVKMLTSFSTRRVIVESIFQSILT